MELHRKLTVVGMVLLAATLILDSGHSEGFNYAYVPGVAMLAAFSISFVIFTRERLQES